MRRILDAFGTRRYLDIECFLLAGDDLAGFVEQNAQLSIGMRRTNMGQDHHPATVFAHDPHRHPAGGGAYFPHVRHRPKLPV